MTRVAKIERKTEYFPIVGEVKATNDAQGITEGYLNFIGNIDYGDDRTLAGAFKRTISDSYSRKSAQGLDFLWPYLWNHDYNILPPGGIFEANEDKKGLFIKTQYNMETQLGRELYSSFKMGTMKKQSMGYKAIQYDYVKEAARSIRNLIEIAIMEGSAVVFPMNDLSDVTTVKNSGRRIFVMAGQAKAKPAKKDFNATYQERLQSDWLDDLWNPWFALKSEIVSAFQIGDSPVEDVRAALDQFNDAMLAYVQQGVDLGMVEALQPADNGESQYYNWMSDTPDHENKAGRALSAANHAILTKAVKGMEGHIKEIKSVMTVAQQQGLPGGVMSADNPPHTKTDHNTGQLDDAAVSTHLDDVLASIQLANFSRQLKIKK